MSPFRTAAALTFVYAFLGFIWILYSDEALMRVVTDTETLSELQTYKGWFYVLITSLLLFALVFSAFRREQQLTQRDSLTQLWNRYMFMRELRSQHEVAEQRDESLTLFVLNIDGFRHLNNNIGQVAGDRLLSDVASCLRQHFDVRALIGRLGGDEFAVAMRDMDWRRDIIPLIESLQHKLANIHLVGRSQQKVSVSIGLANYPLDAQDVRSLLNNAYVALTEAKESGMGHLRVYNREYGESLQARMQLAQDFRSAISQNQLSLVYQPQFNTKTFALSGVEALLRWHHPALGSISPDVFIPIAEQQNLIHDVTDFVCRTAIDELQDAGLLYAKIPRLSINVSAKDFTEDDSTQRFLQRFNNLSGSWDVLQLEITETAAIEHIDKVQKVLKSLGSKGIRVSLDDFGTGYSSLNILRQLPIQELKIDRSFISAVPDAGNDCKLVRTIIAMGNALNLNVVAEGVETQSQVDFLNTKQCAEVQGYFFSKPLPLAQLSAFIQEHIKSNELSRTDS